MASPRRLQPGTRVHISSDKKGRTCFFASVDDATLVCSRRPASGTHYTFPRSEVRTVKLTRYTVSTLAGMGIGAGAGLGIGAALGPAVAPKTNSFLDFSGLGREVILGPRWRDRFYRRRRNRRSLRFSLWPHPLPGDRAVTLLDRHQSITQLML